MNEHYDDLEGVRSAGYAFVEEAIRHLDRTTGPVTTPKRPGELSDLLEAPPPAEGRSLEQLVDRLRGHAVGESIRLAHPMYMGHQMNPPLPVAALADGLVSMLNQSQAIHELSPTGTLIERGLIRWLCSRVGFDDADAAGGSFVSGGSAANLTGLLAARAARFPDAWRTGAPRGAAIVTGEHAHYSVARAAGILGIGADSVVAVPTTGTGATDPRGVAEALDALAAEGRPVLAVVATAGSTATGSFDDLEAIADHCEPHDAWLHVDGAHGASGLLSERTRPRLRGIGRADSVSWDPHKMMFQPLSTAVILTRDRRLLERAFQQNAPYLFPPAIDDAEAEVPEDGGASTIQCSRRSDAIRLWIALEYYGTDTIARLFDHTVDLAAALHDRLEETPDFEPVHAPECNILCFRHRPADADHADLDPLQDRLRARYNASGRGWISAATVEGHRTLRVTLINPRTREEHLDRMIDGLRAEADALTGTGQVKALR